MFDSSGKSIVGQSPGLGFFDGSKAPKCVEYLLFRSSLGCQFRKLIAEKHLKDFDEAVRKVNEGDRRQGQKKMHQATANKIGEVSWMFDSKK